MRMKGKFCSSEKAELFNLLHRNRITLICGPVSIALVGILMILTVLLIDGPERKIENTVSSLGYSYALESNTPVEKNSYIKFDAIDSLKNDSHRTNVNVYMQLADEKYDSNVPMSCKLSDGEIAISEKTANKLKVKVGDRVQLDFVMYEEPINYNVKYIFGYVSDFYKFEENQDFSPVLLAYDSNIAAGMKNKYTLFMSQEDRDAFMKASGSYLSETNVQDELVYIGRMRKIIQGISLTMFLGVLAVYLRLLSGKLYGELERYYFDSYSIKTIREYGACLLAICIVIPISIGWAFAAILTVHGIVIKQAAYAYTVISIIVTLIMYIRNGRIYGKAH